MTGFKEQMAADLDGVFFNTAEFAETARLRYEGRAFEAAVILQDMTQIVAGFVNPRGWGYKAANDIDAVYEADMTMSVRKTDFETQPQKGYPIWVNDVFYEIVQIAEDCGMLSIVLTRRTE